MVLPGPAPEAIPELVLELVHGAALSAARGVAPEPVHALSVDLAPLPVHGSGSGVVRGTCISSNAVRSCVYMGGEDHVQEQRRGPLMFLVPDTANPGLDHKGIVGKRNFKKTLR